MSQNIQQIFVAQPATSMQTTDLMYLGRSPFGASNDMAITWANILNTIYQSFWTVVSSSTQTLAANKGYITDNGASLVTYTLPASCTVGSIIKIVGKSSGGWTIAQLASQQIFFGSQATTIGVAGSLSSTIQYQSLDLLCITANLGFEVITPPIGNVTVV